MGHYYDLIWSIKVKLFISFILFVCWLVYAVKTRWAYRFSHLVLSRFVGFVAFQYNRGFRQAFITDFDLREPPNLNSFIAKEQEKLTKKSVTIKSAPAKSTTSKNVPSDVETESSHTNDTASTITEDDDEDGKDEAVKQTRNTQTGDGIPLPRKPKKSATQKAEDNALSKTMTEIISYSIDQFIMRNKRIPYLVAKSVCNEVAQRLTCYIHEYQQDIIKDNACFKMMNVDYLADMDYWLTFMKPIILYSFVPEGVGGTLLSGTFSAKQDVFAVVKDDGSTYKHMVWDYGYEYVTVDSCWGVTICPIEQFKIVEEPHYRVLCIIPATFVPVPFSMLVERRCLDRLTVTFETENILRVMDSTGREHISMSTLGSCMDCVVPADLFDILRIKQENQKQSIRSIEKFLKKERVPKEHICGALIYQILKKKKYPPENMRLTRITSCEEARYKEPRTLIVKKKNRFSLSFNTSKSAAKSRVLSGK